MAKKSSRDLMKPTGGGVFRSLVLRLKLVLRLMADKRVNPLLKVLPIASLVYLIWPIDLIMGLPGVSALDDAAIVSLGMYLFVEFCPPEVVQEHLEALRQERHKTDIDDEIDEIVEGEAVDIEDEKT